MPEREKKPAALYDAKVASDFSFNPDRILVFAKIPQIIPKMPLTRYWFAGILKAEIKQCDQILHFLRLVLVQIFGCYFPSDPHFHRVHILGGDSNDPVKTRAYPATADAQYLSFSPFNACT